MHTPGGGSCSSSLAPLAPSRSASEAPASLARVHFAVYKQVVPAAAKDGGSRSAVGRAAIQSRAVDAAASARRGVRVERMVRTAGQRGRR